MLKFTVSEVAVGSIIWRADLKSGQHSQVVQTFSGAIEADEIDEEEFVQALWDKLKCVGDLSISLMRSAHESKFNIEASCDDTGCDIHGTDCDGGDCPDFVIGVHSQCLRPQEA